MIKAVLVLKTSGSCRYYRIYDKQWSAEEKNVEVISYITAVTSIIGEFGETSPKLIEFGNNEIVCEAKGEYILTIVKEKGTFESLVTRVKKNFQDNFQPLEVIKESTPWIEDEDFLEKEREGIYHFMRNLNLIINKRTIISQRKKPVVIDVEDDLEKPLLIQDVDMLITLESGQPVFLMLTLSLPYDATLITAFMSAVLDLGKSIGLGELKLLESENLIIYVQKIEKAFTVVITQNKNYRSVYRRFAEFVADLCNDWLYKEGIEIDEAFQIFEEKKHFEEIIKILIDTDTWEKHLIKEWERDYAEHQRIEN
ncbi:MAG: hypothetical protein HeimAB125_19000 [Candidatus Heimdallarchaeota archaeon AB_125]|nr:MAG: hypothetical protein HeimAB125_19000 [Candidatus Heimdallarchaeota archaeon AB_125]